MGGGRKRAPVGGAWAVSRRRRRPHPDRIWAFWRPIVGDGVQQAGLAHALALVINDDPRGRVFALEADLNGALGQVAGSFEAQRFEGEGVVGAHVAFFLDEEQFVVGLVGREEAHPAAVQGEAVQGRHAQHGVELGVVTLPRPSE